MKRLILPCVVVVAFVIAATPAALADSGTSANWAGYAVHAPGVGFTRVLGAWTQPRARCRRGHSTYSAMWVGIGGFAGNAPGLEQVGTELDCTASGRMASTAWYELIPAPSQATHMRVRPGDSMAASVTVVGHQVTMDLSDLTTHARFQKVLQAPSIDISSAEWIVEAPSECTSASSCRTLPLANFGTARFSLAQAQSSNGHMGTISDRAWRSTKIRLTPGGRRFVAYHGSGPAAGAARTSRLHSSGSAFSVTFGRVSAGAGKYLGRLRDSGPGAYLVHGPLSL